MTVPRVAPSAAATVRRCVALASIALAGCTGSPAAAPVDRVPLLVTVSSSVTSVATIAIEVTAADIDPPLVFNLAVTGGSASGVVYLPVGDARRIAARAFDATGEMTHEGATIVDVVPGSNPPVAIAMMPVLGDVPITITIGPVTVAVAPSDVTLAPGETVAMSATVTDALGEVVPAAEVMWGSTAPSVATVDLRGVVSAVAVGDALVAATYAGTTGVARIHVAVLPVALSPTTTPAGGIYTSGVQVALASATPGASLYYTLDGSRPTPASSRYVGPIAVSSTAVVKAIAAAPGYQDSDVTTAIFVVEPGGTLNGHTVVLDGASKLVSWLPATQAYAAVVDRTWDALFALPVDARGRSVFFLYPYVLPGTLQLPDWPNAPASALSMLVESALLSYPLSGDPRVVSFAKSGLDAYLVNGMTSSTDAWSSVPYSEGDPGSQTYRGATDTHWGGSGIGDGVGVLEPDKVAELGLAFLRMYEWDGTASYLDAAVRCANALVANRVSNTSMSRSPWPFRVYAATNQPREAYTAHVLPAIQLFDELIRLGLGDFTGYAVARGAAWTWLLAYPMLNGIWSQYFEDVAIQTSYDNNLNQLVAGNTARHLAERPELDSNWEPHVRGILTFIEREFAKAPVYGATPIGEQVNYNLAMGSHTSRYGALNALLAERTGDTAAREKAYRALNWATYMNRADRFTIDGVPSPNQIWMTDGFGDYVRHFAVAMGAVPEWAPPGEDHLLRSTSVVRSVTYGRGSVAYRTFDGAAQEVLRLTFTPSEVVAGGVPLPQRPDLSLEGWTWAPATGVLRVRHDHASDVVVR